MRVWKPWQVVSTAGSADRPCQMRTNCFPEEGRKRKGTNMSRESNKLLALIKQSIEDGVVTNDEYSRILAQAAADGREDPEELALLSHLRELIANGTVKRVA